MSSSVIDLDKSPGLERAKKAVSRVLAANSEIHALLLYGPSGAGKSDLAALVSKAWLCTSPTPQGTACNECNVCLSHERGRAVDAQVWRPWGPQSLIKLSAMHEVTQWDKDRERPGLDFVLDFVRTRPLMSRNKVVTFIDADRMNSDAANALLKTLEEPPAGVKFVLTTSHFSRVLPTVRSRCLCLACELPSKESATLAGDYFSPVESVFGGSPGGVAHVRSHSAVFTALYDLLESTGETLVGAALKTAESAREIASAYAKSADLNARAANAKVIEAIAEWVRQAKPERHDVLKRAAECHRLILGNAQPGPVFEVLFMDLLSGTGNERGRGGSI